MQIILPPTILPAAGTYYAVQTVSITPGITGATIRYTTDGSTPTTTHGTIYVNPFTMNASETVQAICYITGTGTSTVASNSYIVRCAPPIITPGAGTYAITYFDSYANQTNTPNAGVLLQLDCLNFSSNTNFIYTLDGTTPSRTNGLYPQNQSGSPGTVYVKLTASCTINVISIDLSGVLPDSVVTSAAYVIGTTGTEPVTPTPSSSKALASSIWPMHAHDLQHTSRSSNAQIVPSTSLGLIWSTTAIGGMDFVIGTDGTIYAASLSPNNLVAVNHLNGNVLWTLAYPVNSPLALAIDGTLYFGSGASLYAVNTGTQAVAWTYATGGSVASAPAISADGTIIFCSTDGYVYALNSDGSLKWKLQVDNGIGVDKNFGGGLLYEAHPAIAANGTIYIYLSSGTTYPYGYNLVTNIAYGFLYAINPDGTVQWQFPFLNAGSRTYYSPSIGSDGTIYIIIDGNAVIAFHPDGSIKWTASLPANGWAIVQSNSPSIGTDNSIWINRHINNYMYTNEYVNISALGSTVNVIMGATNSFGSLSLDSANNVLDHLDDSTFYNQVSSSISTQNNAVYALDSNGYVYVITPKFLLCLRQVLPPGPGGATGGAILWHRSTIF